MNHPERKEVEIFNAAMELSSPAERAAYLDQMCGDDEPLRQKVDALLRDALEAEDFFKTAAAPESPAPNAGAWFRPTSSDTAHLPIAEKPGDKIGRYKLRERVGEGGCGVVYVAEQEEPMRRRVALKVIKLGMDTKSVIARFEAERQALALMDHPNIAKVLDAGATETGRPYFVMELVRGIKITDYCDQHQLPTHARLDLFVKVCQAVQHAHQKGIIHRDLKPSNILVTLHDGVPVPKVIDFGIAKATEGRLTERTVYTELNQFIGTPAYMSPEQAEMSGLDIDTRSDIYSLGVLLYELLTGKTPFDARELWDAGLETMRRTIRDQEPVRPSTRLQTMLDGELSITAKHRQADAPKLISLLRGDLDWVVMKALEKDRTRRYDTATGFAQDIQRHLSNEAVTARPPSLSYKLQKTVRRNKPAFITAAAVLAALMVGLFIASWQAVRATNAEQQARLSMYSERHMAKHFENESKRAVRAEADARIQTMVATNALQTATNALQAANENLVKLHVAEGWRRVEEGDYFAALYPFALALSLEAGNAERANFHRLHLASVLQQCPKLVNVWTAGTTISHAEFSRDGSRLLASATLFRTQEIVRIWDAVTGRPLTAPMQHHRRVNFLQWNSDESRIATASEDKTARVWDAFSGRPLTPPLSHETMVLQARFNGDGTKLVTTSLGKGELVNLGVGNPNHPWTAGKLQVWNVPTGNLLWSSTVSLPTISDPVLFSPDGQHVVTPDHLLDAATGKLLTKLSNGPGDYAAFHGFFGSARPPTSLEEMGETELMSDQNLVRGGFNSDGSRLLFTGWMSYASDHSSMPALLRDGHNPTETVASFWPPISPYLCRFSRDGKMFATAIDDATVRIWDAADGSPVSPAIELTSFATDLQFSPEGDRLVTACDNGTTRIWEVKTAKPLSPNLSYRGKISRVAFTSAGEGVVVVGEWGTVAVWDFRMAGVARFTWPTPECGGRIQLSSDGQVLTATTSLGKCTWNLNRGEPILPPLQAGEPTLTTNGSHLVATEGTGWSVWALSTGRKISHHVPNQATNGLLLQLARNGQWVLAYYGSGSLRSNLVSVFDAHDGRLLARLESAGPISQVAINHLGTQVAALQTDNVGVIWNLPDPQPALSFGTNAWRWHPRFSPRGNWILTGCEGGTELWNAKTGQLELKTVTLDDHWEVPPVSHDDRWLVWRDHPGCYVQGISATWPQTLTLNHRGVLNAAIFASDDKTLITSGSDRTVRFWHLQPSWDSSKHDEIRQPASVSLRLGSKIDKICNTPNGKQLVTALGDDSVSVWSLPESNEKLAAHDWIELAHLFQYGTEEGLLAFDWLTDYWVETTTNSHFVEKSFQELWETSHAKHPELFTVSATEIDGWHRREAWRCESSQNWSNAVAHLTHLLELHPESGDFLPRRAAAWAAWAERLGTEAQATNLLERALNDYHRTLAWVDRFPALARASRKPFVEKRRAIYLKLARNTEAEADERELQNIASDPTQP